MSVEEHLEVIDMPEPIDERGDIPLYVKVPATAQDYLNKVKEDTGITKTDSVTLILEIAAKYISTETLLKMYDEYIVLGRDGLDLSDICDERKT